MNKLKICSLFSGLGGFERGIEQALGKENIEVVFSCEIDKYASKSYEILHGVKPFHDVTQVIPEELPNFDLLVGGFPCQSYSIAGKRKGFEDTRGTLFFDILRIAKVKQPKVMLLENVKGIVNHDKGNTMNVILESLAEIGYKVTWKVLNSKDFGVAQNRERCFFLCSLDQDFEYEFPEPTNTYVRLKDILESAVDENFYLSEAHHQKFVPKQTLHRADKSANQIIVEGKVELDGWQDHMKRIYDTEGIAPTLDTMQGGNRQPKIAVEEAWLSAHASKKVKERLGEKEGALYNYYNDIVYQEDDVSGTLTTSSGSWTGKTGFTVINGMRLRKITPLECFRLQGFPDSWYHTLKAHGISNTQLYKMSGNAVTTTVIEALVRQIYK